MKRKLEYRWMLWCGIWAVVTLLVACDHLAKPSSSGRPYEVLVVVGDSLWQRPAGRALFDVLRIFPAFRSPSVRSGFRKPTRNVSIRC